MGRGSRFWAFVDNLWILLRVLQDGQSHGNGMRAHLSLGPGLEAAAEVFHDGSDLQAGGISLRSAADRATQQRLLVIRAQNFSRGPDFARLMDDRPAGGRGEHGFGEIRLHTVFTTHFAVLDPQFLGSLPCGA